MTSVEARAPRKRWWLVVGAALPLGIACSPSPTDAVFTEPGTAPLACTLDGTWATFVEVGVGWQSGTIDGGAGTVIQWILGKRTMTPDGAHEESHSCGIGAHNVPIGSPWFATRDLFIAGNHIPSEWTGVTFSAQLFDSGLLRNVPVDVHLDVGNPNDLKLGNAFSTAVVPFSHGVDNLDPDTWPDRQTMLAYAVDHDADGAPGLTGHPFQGEVGGQPPGTVFTNPRLDLNATPVRTSALFMGIRNRAALNGTFIGCDPPRFVGKVVETSLLIEIRNFGCIVADTGLMCDDGQIGFIDVNLPQFKPNGTSRVVSVKVKDDTTCAQARRLLSEEAAENGFD